MQTSHKNKKIKMGNCFSIQKKKNSSPKILEKTNKKPNLRWKEIKCSEIETITFSPAISNLQDTMSNISLLVDGFTPKAISNLFLLNKSSLRFYCINANSIKILEAIELSEVDTKLLHCKTQADLADDMDLLVNYRDHHLHKIHHLPMSLSFNTRNHTLNALVQSDCVKIISFKFSPQTSKLLTIYTTKIKHQRRNQMHNALLFDVRLMQKNGQRASLVATGTKKNHGPAFAGSRPRAQLILFSFRRFQHLTIIPLSQDLLSQNSQDEHYLRQSQSSQFLKIYSIKEKYLVIFSCKSSTFVSRIYDPGRKKILRTTKISFSSISVTRGSHRRDIFNIKKIMFDRKQETLILLLQGPRSSFWIFVAKKQIQEIFQPNKDSFFMTELNHCYQDQYAICLIGDLILFITTGSFSKLELTLVNCETGKKDLDIVYNLCQLEETGLFDYNHLTPLEVLPLDSESVVIVNHMKIMVFKLKSKTVTTQRFHSFFPLDGDYIFSTKPYFFGDLVAYPTEYGFHMLSVKQGPNLGEARMDVKKSIYIPEILKRAQVGIMWKNNRYVRKVIANPDGNLLLLFNSLSDGPCLSENLDHYDENLLGLGRSEKGDVMNVGQISFENQSGQHSLKDNISSSNHYRLETRQGAGTIEIDRKTFKVKRKGFSNDSRLENVDFHNVFPFSKNLLVFIVHPDTYFDMRTIRPSSSFETEIAISSRSFKIKHLVKLSSQYKKYSILGIVSAGVMITNEKTMFYYFKINTKEKKLEMDKKINFKIFNQILKSKDSVKAVRFRSRSQYEHLLNIKNSGNSASSKNIGSLEEKLESWDNIILEFASEILERNHRGQNKSNKRSANILNFFETFCFIAVKERGSSSIFYKISLRSSPEEGVRVKIADEEWQNLRHKTIFFDPNLWGGCSYAFGFIGQQIKYSRLFEEGNNFSSSKKIQKKEVEAII